MLYIFRKLIRKNLVYIITFEFQFLCDADCLKWINETTTFMEICTGLVDAVLGPKRLANRLYINRNGFLLLFFFFFWTFQRSAFNSEKESIC